MAENSRDTQAQPEARFTGLVIMLSQSAMLAMGKLVDPNSGQAQVDLQTARTSIDLLEMLQEKTSGNLSEIEKRLLADTLSSLQMTYVDAAAAARNAPADAETAPSEPAAADEPGEPADQADQSAPDTDPAHEPKYHKSYG